jgi:hypothetical protein
MPLVDLDEGVAGKVKERGGGETAAGTRSLAASTPLSSTYLAVLASALAPKTFFNARPTISPAEVSSSA